MKQHYIEWLMPGSFLSETYSEKVQRAGFVPEKIPDRVFGYRHYSRTEMISNGEHLVGSPSERTGTTYFGEELDMAGVIALNEKFDGNYRILISNMENNGWTRVVRTRFGQFFPLEDGDNVKAA